MGGMQEAHGSYTYMRSTVQSVFGSKPFLHAVI